MTELSEPQVTSEAENEVVVAALLHDIGWKLSRCEPTKLEAQETQTDDECCKPEQASMAEQLGILALCGGKHTEEQLQAQHDVIGATFLRWLAGFDLF